VVQVTEKLVVKRRKTEMTKGEEDFEVDEDEDDCDDDEDEDAEGDEEEEIDEEAKRAEIELAHAKHRCVIILLFSCFIYGHNKAQVVVQNQLLFTIVVL